MTGLATTCRGATGVTTQEVPELDTVASSTDGLALSNSWNEPTVPSGSTSTENLVGPLTDEISTSTAVPRIPMVATGVSTRMSPVFATLPATKLMVPWTMLIRAEL